MERRAWDRHLLELTDTDSLMYEIKTEDFYGNKEMFDFGNYSTKSKYYDVSNKLVIGKINDKTSGVVIDEFVGLESNMYSLLVNSEHKQSKDMNRNVVAKISQKEYEDSLSNNNCLKHSRNRIQSKDHRIGTYKTKKISLYCFDHKLYIQNNGCDGLAFGYQS